MINPLQESLPIVKESGEMEPRFTHWARQVTREGLLTGEGSPEGVVEAIQGRQYMDTIGTTGNILYIKRDADILGIRTEGWILV